MRVSAAAKELGRSERMLRNDLKKGLMEAAGEPGPPVLVDVEKARAWLAANAAGATPGPGRPKKSSGFQQIDGSRRNGAGFSGAPQAGIGPKTSPKVSHTPLSIDGATLERVLSGSATQKEVFDFAVNSGIDRASLEKFLSVQKLIRDSHQIRRSFGEMLEASDVRATWSGFLISLERMLTGLPARIAREVMAVAGLNPEQEPRIRDAISAHTEALRGMLLEQEGDTDGEGTG